MNLLVVNAVHSEGVGGPQKSAVGKTDRRGDPTSPAHHFRRKYEA